MRLEQLLEQVNSKETFFAFLHALSEDKRDEDRREKLKPSSPYTSGVNGWEHTNIATYLDSMYKWGTAHELNDTPSWRSFAQILYAAKFED